MQQATDLACPHCECTLDDLDEPLADHINNTHRTDRAAPGETRRGP